MKKIGSIDAIRAEIRRKINTSKWANGYCAGCEAPLPLRIQHDGVANWIAPVPAGALRGCEGFLLDVVASVRHEYDLPPQSLAEIVKELHSVRKSPF